MGNSGRTALWKVYAGETIAMRVRELVAQDYSIHFHTFISDDIHALMKHCTDVEQMPLSIVFAGDFEDEMIFIIRKLNSSTEFSTLSVDQDQVGFGCNSSRQMRS